MAANNRIFYACQLVGLSEMGTSGTPAGLPWTGASGTVPSGLVLFTSGSAMPSEQLNLRIRGK